MSPLNRFRMPMPGPPEPFARVDGGELPPIPLVRQTGAAAPRPLEPFAPIAMGRDITCSGCGNVCRYEASVPPRPESPEFLKTGDVWLGFSVDPVTETLSCIAACSEKCLSRLLRE